MERAQFFSDSLEYLSLASYKGFQDFKECASLIQNRLHGFPIVLSQEFLNANLDTVSMDIFPNQEFPDLAPVKVSGDGNCLPRSASMLVFGDQHHHIEMRVRMACELALNKDFYLNDTNHKMYCFDTFPYCSTITTYSFNFKLGMDTDRATIETVFELDAMATAKSGNYCGIWHLYALSSIVGCRLYSIYPKLKSTVTIRPELNRIIFPRKQMSKRTIAVFWTNTNEVKDIRYWKPNHFAPCFQKHFIMNQKQNREVSKLNLQDKTMEQTPHKLPLNSQLEAPIKTTVTTSDTIQREAHRTHSVRKIETPQTLNLSQTETPRKKTVMFSVESKCELSINFVTKRSRKIYIKTIKGSKNPLKNIFKFFMKHHIYSRGPDVSFYEIE